MFRLLLLFILLIPGISPVMADEEMTSSLICPCECAMVISTCDCPTAIQVKKEISSMRESGFSEKQISSALQAEYGKGILVHPEKTISISLWVGVLLAVILGFVGYIATRKPNPDVIPDMEKYEKRFEEEYRKFVYGFEDPKDIHLFERVRQIDENNENPGHFPKGISTMEEM